MGEVLLYPLKVGIASSVMTIAYLIFLRKENLFQVNRLYLISAATLPWIFPLITITYTKQLEAIPITVPSLLPLSYVPSNVHYVEITRSVNLHFLIPGIVYMAGVFFFMIKLLFSFFKISRIIKNSKEEIRDDDIICVTDRNLMPFSFFNSLVIPKYLRNHLELDLIIKHETCHIRQWHSFDIVTAELFKVLQWFNPFAWVLAKNIKTNIEYIADKYVTMSGFDLVKYQNVLFSVAHDKLALQLVSSLSQSQLKDRFMMMKRTNFIKRFSGKYVLMLPVITMLLLSFCKKEIKYDYQDGLVVTGKVTTDVCDIPIPGVYVGIKEEITGVVTDDQGEYKIALGNPDDTLEFVYPAAERSAFGTGTKQVAVNGRHQVDIAFEDPGGLLNGAGKILGQDEDPIIIVNDQRVKNGFAMGIRPELIYSVQVLEGDQAVQYFGKEDARQGLVIIKGEDGSFLKGLENPEGMIILDGKRYNGSLASINPLVRGRVHGYTIRPRETMTQAEINEYLSPHQRPMHSRFMFVTTGNVNVGQMIDKSIIDILSGEKEIDVSAEPIIFVNGTRYDKDKKEIDPATITNAITIEGDEAYEISGIDEARERGLVLMFSPEGYYY